jgi:hypothetical protein
MGDHGRHPELPPLIRHLLGAFEAGERAQHSPSPQQRFGQRLPAPVQQQLWRRHGAVIRRDQGEGLFAGAA